MTVKELLNDCLCEIWITTGEDPNRDPIEIKAYAQSDYEEEEMLSEAILNSEIHLITADDDKIKISLFWGDEE